MHDDLSWIFVVDMNIPILSQEPVIGAVFIIPSFSLYNYIYICETSQVAIACEYSQKDFRGCIKICPCIIKFAENICGLAQFSF